MKNEYIKYTVNFMMPLYVKIFNRIFESGIIPEDWLIGIILPLYKNNGDLNDPNNLL